MHGLLFQALRVFARFFAVNAVNQVSYPLDNAARRNAVGFVVGDLLGAPPLGFVHGLFHGVGDAVGIQNGPAIQVARRAANGLDQAALRAQKAFLVRVQNRHQRHLGNIQPLAQQVDTHQHIERAQPQVADDFHPLHGVHITVQVTHLHAVVGEVIGELLGHALGQCGDQHALVLFHADADFLQHVVHLVGGGPHLHHRVHQPRRTNHLIHDLARVGFLVVGWSGRYENRLPHALLKFLELERPVVQRRRQAKAIFHQCGLARAVAVVHGRKLPDHLVALVQEHDGVLGHVVGQRAGRVSRRCTRQVARVVFNALAVPYFAEHFQVKPGALLQPLGFHQFAVGHQLLQALGQLQLDGLHRCQHLVTRGDVVAAGVHGKAWDLLLDAPRERVEQLQALDLIIKQLDANGQLGVFCRKHVDRVAAHPELATRKIGFVTLVLHADELRNHVALAQLVPHAQRHHHAVIALGLANTVDG